jgi:hypothetical protein
MFSTQQVSRRDMLRVGGLTALGLTLSDLTTLRASGKTGKAKSCILVWLDGGPSHLETFDLKPDAPSEVRGPAKPIATNVSGLSVCEWMPNIAKIADKLAVVRSVTSPLGEHGIANHYVLTGYKPSPVLEYPSYGAVVAHLSGGGRILPPYIAIPEVKSTAGAGYLDAACRPFATGGDPGRPDFAVRDLNFFPNVTEARMDRRKDFLAQLDRFDKSTAADPDLERAYRLTTTPDAKKAFDLNDEKAAVRARYGPRTIGQSCLLARRLVERGVPFVTVNNTGWDTHNSLVLRLKEGFSGAKVGVGLVPTFDIAFAALIGDLAERGLLDETLVIGMGEFGRTPKLNAADGRDHWPRVFSAVFAGGGIKGGQVIGSSDRVGESPKDRPVTPADLARTIYTLLGIDPKRELQTADGRPVQINQGGEVVKELLA